MKEKVLKSNKRDYLSPELREKVSMSHNKSESNPKLIDGKK